MTTNSNNKEIIIDETYSIKFIETNTFFKMSFCVKFEDNLCYFPIQLYKMKSQTDRYYIFNINNRKTEDSYYQSKEDAVDIFNTLIKEYISNSWEHQNEF